MTNLSDNLIMGQHRVVMQVSCGVIGKTRAKLCLSAHPALSATAEPQ